MRFETLQGYYSLAGRDLEREIVPFLEDQRVGLLVWSPLAGGLLAGRSGRGEASPEGTRRATLQFPVTDVARTHNCIDAMRPMAEGREVSVAQVALPWLLHRKFVTTVIVGAKRIEQLDDNLAATRLRLDAAELRALDEVSTLRSEYPGWMFDAWVHPRRIPA